VKVILCGILEIGQAVNNLLLICLED